MDTIVSVSKEDIKDMDIIINNFVSKYAEDVVSIGALALCLQTLIDKRDELEKFFSNKEDD